MEKRIKEHLKRVTPDALSAHKEQFTCFAHEASASYKRIYIGHNGLGDYVVKFTEGQQEKFEHPADAIDFYRKKLEE